MKNFIIPILILLAIFGLFSFTKIKKLQQTADMLDIGTPKFEFKAKLKDLLKILASWSIDAIVSIPINNYSKNNFTIRQISADIYTPGGVLLADQNLPLKEAVVVKPNSQSIIKLPYTINLSGIVDIVAQRKNLNADENLLKSIVQTWFTKGTIGEKVIIKGFIIPEELKGIKIKLNEEVEF